MLKKNTARHLSILVAVIALSPLVIMSLVFAGNVIIDNLAVYRMEALPRKEQSSELLTESVQEMQFFRVRGLESSVDWITELDGQLVMTGFVIDTGYTVVNADDDEHTLLLLFVPETVSELTIYHVLPLIETPDTVISSENLPEQVLDEGLSGTNVSTDDLSGRDHYEGHRPAQVGLGIHDGWLHANHITGQVNPILYGSPFSWVVSELNIYEIFASSIGRFPGKAEWLDVSEKKPYDLSGVSNGGHIDVYPYSFDNSALRLPEGYIAAMQILVPDRLGSAPIYHLAKVHFMEEADVRDLGGDRILNPGWNVTVPVVLSGGLLVYSRQ
ncbi:MAG: hypothetical protein FWC99_06070 [Coriobacteriia bacterium]|nr:hypothetical protein [Coriobacteriia bacterium]